MNERTGTLPRKELIERREQVVELFRRAGEQLGNVVADFCTSHGLPIGVERQPFDGAALLSQRDAAKYLGIGLSLLYQIRALGEIQVVKVQGKTLVTRKSLDAYVDRLERLYVDPLAGDDPRSAKALIGMSRREGTKRRS